MQCKETYEVIDSRRKDTLLLTIRNMANRHKRPPVSQQHSIPSNILEPKNVFTSMYPREPLRVGFFQDRVML